MRLALILVMLLPTLLHAEGRLFFTPAERGHLDQLRKTSKPPQKHEPAEATSDPASEAPPPAVVTIQGYVKRSDGKGTVWVNRQAVQEKSSNGEITVGRLGAKDNRVEVKLPGSSKAINLKAGQTYDTTSGMIVDEPRQWPDVREAAPPPASEPRPKP